MSSLIRTPKSASDWTHNDLKSYHVTIEEQTAALFFGQAKLPEPNCPEGFLHNLTTTENTDRATDELLWGIGDAEGRLGLGEASVDQFARSLFLETGFTNKRVRPSVRRPLPLLIGGEQRSAQTDVCLIYDDTVLLLVQEDKAEGRPVGYGEAQLVAEAIAARQHNVIGGALDEDATETMPAILMIGTYPVFYRIPVSSELDLSVGSLSYPAAETKVTKCSPELPRPSMRYGEGMVPLDNRAVILRHFEAFRRYVFAPCSEATLGRPILLPPPGPEHRLPSADRPSYGQA